MEAHRMMVGDTVEFTYHDKLRTGVVDAVTERHVLLKTDEGYRTFLFDGITQFKLLVCSLDWEGIPEEDRAEQNARDTY